jgi:hypothetical protein
MGKSVAFDEQKNKQQHWDRNPEKPKQNIARRTRLFYFVVQMHF